MKEQIADFCKRLRLSKNIADSYDRIDADSKEEYLLKILLNEVKYRETAKKNRLIKQAQFYYLKTFENYCFEEIRIPANLSIDDIKKAAFVQDKRNLILYGNVGSGKTHMSIAIGIEACNQGKSVQFYRTAALVNQLNDAKKKGELGKFLKHLSKADLLICDEWGYIPLDRDGSKFLFQVISDCYEQRSVIITTNLEFSRWVNIFYDEQMTAAMIDRLVHHSYLLVFDGPSHRLKNSIMKGYN